MSDIRPFPGIRYATQPGAADISTRLAPPYDVLDTAGKEALLDRDPGNFVKIDLPHVPAKAAGPAEVYSAARQQLDAWLKDGTLVHDAEPGLYVYHQAYTHAGTTYVRKMFFARLRLEPLGEGSVFPHEQTFGGPKEDRLCLTRATEANLSPIFGLYPDAGNAIAARLQQAIGRTPLASGRLESTQNRLWAVTDPQTINDVAGMMADRPMFIADGHHRYGTALLYRDELRSKGELAEDHPANYVLCVLCAMEDPGLLILPTHRVLVGHTVSGGMLREDENVEVAHLLVEDAEAAPAALAKFGPQALGVYDSAEGRYYMARPREATLLDDLEPEHSEAWRRLGLAFLHAYLLERMVRPTLTGGQDPEIHYVKSAAGAVDEARGTGGTAFLMQPTTMEELRAVCQAGDLMPQKSTFFYPKLASGLVVNPLRPA